MSCNAEREPDEEEGKMIPVFTVIKNGVILKNIFVVNKPPSPLSELSSFASVENTENPDQETEEMLIVGRHPDCNIVLMHPSISRFHFQINSKPSSQKLFVTDLSSVHGTWVSEKKTDPGFRVELKEGDTIRVGGSTRVYRLHWIPLSRAYDMENPFVSESDLAYTEEKEEEDVEKMSQNEDLLVTENKNVEDKDPLVVLGKVEETNQNIDSFHSENGAIQSVDSVLQGFVFPDENSGLIVKKDIPSGSLMSKDMDSSFQDGKEEIENSSRSDYGLSLKSVGGVIFQTLSAIFYECNQNPESHSAKEENPDISMTGVELEAHVDCSSDSPSSVTEVDLNSPKGTTSQNLLRNNHKQIDTFSLQPLRERGLSETNNENINKENQTREHLAPLHPLCEEGSSAENQKSNESVNPQNICSNDPAAPTEKLETEEYVNSSIPLGEVLAKSKGNPTLQSDFSGTGNLENITSPEYFSAKEENTEISMTRLELESHVHDSSDSPPSITKVPSAFRLPKETQNQSLLRKEHKQIVSSPMQTVQLSMPGGEPSETEERKTRENLAALHPLYEDGNQENPTENEQLNELSNLQNICSNDLAATEMLEEMENQGPLGKEGVLSELAIVSPVPFEKGSLGEILFKSQESQTPASDLRAIGNLEHIMGSPVRSERKSSSCNIWARRGKPATPLQLQTSTSRRKTRRDDVNDGDSEREKKENVESKSISRAFFSDSGAMDEEIFTPDKENCTPNTIALRSLMKGRLDDIQLSKSSRSKLNFSPNTRLQDEMIGSSDKENQTPKALRERKSARSSKHHIKLEEDVVHKERRVERAPLQSLISNSPARNMSEASFPSAATRSSTSTSSNQKKINSIGYGRRRWTIIADTTSLLDKETRKALQLLQGLKRTHLIIPRMVIRELDSLKQCGSFFRRTTEASVVLQWIEECLVKTKWWIHVQSSEEEVMPIAPTPPASPVSRFSEGSEVLQYQKRSSASFSAYGSVLEIASPTAEDHILDCALSYRKMSNDGQLVLLSNNVPLKIKAMAEGLICETAKEFRDSLVNPFSERFLWAESSPRGQTWSVMDDIVLKENYYRSPSKKSSRGEAAKGLKLILLHNSNYIKTT